VKVGARWLDRFSSAAFFSGWDAAGARAASALRNKATVDGILIVDPRAVPRTWLLRDGWKRRGLLRSIEVPAI